MKDLYDITIKHPIDTVVQTGTDQFNRTVDLGFSIVDACTENKYAKMIIDPMLNLTEKSLNYLIPDLNIPIPGK